MIDGATVRLAVADRELPPVDSDNAPPDARDAAALFNAIRPQDDAGLGASAMRRRLMEKLFDARTEPTRLGRYQVEEQIGCGGMGAVYRAYEPDLDRHVAIKMLIGNDPADDRFRREARTLAQLSHPNVVHIYQVGKHEDRTYIAMELVVGDSLDRWLAKEPRTWQQILDVFIGAGRGVAAAHACQIVHRDFKPRNVLIDRAGFPRVVDFGLAGGAGARSTSASSDRTRPSSNADGCQTEAGPRVGTPDFMSPEQLRGGLVGPASDQFSFCVALHHALWHAHPFEGTDPPARERSTVEGRLVQMPRPGPRGLRRAVLRGLAVDPTHRFPSMDVLLAELERVQSHAPFKRARIAALVGGSIAAAIVLRVWMLEAPSLCPLDRVLWSAEERGTQLEALSATNAVALDAVSAALDDYAGRWGQVLDNACAEADATHGEARATALATIECLEDARTDFGETLDNLGTPETAGAWRVVIGHLQDPTDCRRRSTEKAAVANRELRTRLERVEVLRLTGKLEQARGLLDPLIDELEHGVDDGALLAEALLARGRILDQQGERLSARQVLVRAQALAAANERPGLELDALIELAAIELVWLHRLPQAETAMSRVRALVERYPEESDYHTQLRWLEGNLYTLKGQLDDAERELSKAAHELSARHPPTDPLVVRVTVDLAEALRSAKRPADALPLYERALRAREEVLGKGHVGTATLHHNIATAWFEQDQLGPARDSYERALAILTDADQRKSLPAGRALVGLAHIALEQGDPARALKLTREASRIAVSPRHRSMVTKAEQATIVATLANIHVARGELNQALAQYRRLLVLDDYDTIPVSRTDVLLNIGNMLIELRRFDDAQQLFDEHSEELRRTLPPDDRRLAYLHWIAAELELHRRARARARESLARALAVLPQPLPPEYVPIRADVEWALARAVAREQEALDHARVARAMYADLGVQTRVVEIDAWLAGRRP